MRWKDKGALRGCSCCTSLRSLPSRLTYTNEALAGGCNPTSEEGLPWRRKEARKERKGDVPVRGGSRGGPIRGSPSGILARAGRERSRFQSQAGPRRAAAPLKAFLAEEIQSSAPARCSLAGPLLHPDPQEPRPPCRRTWGGLQPVQGVPVDQDRPVGLVHLGDERL